MQSNSSAASGNSKTNNTALIIVLVGFFSIFIFVMFGIAAINFFIMMNAAPYTRWTAKASPEIIKIEPATWRENNITGMSKSPGGTHEVEGFSVSYKFTTASGQTVFHTADRHRSSEPSEMAVVCYNPKEPNSCGLYSVNTICPLR